MQNFLSGYLSGYVTDVETEEPIEGVTVITDYGFVATTDSAGFWIIPEALAEKPFNISARKLTYNDSTYVDMLLDNEDTVQVDFALLHPEFTPSVMELGTAIDPEQSDTLVLSIENTGNGPLDWRMERHLPRGADVDPWVHRESIMVGDTLDNPRLNGVVFGNDQFFVSGRRIDDDSLHQIYVLSNQGELIRSFDQPDIENRNGMRDLAWDKHNEILWGAVEETVFGYSPDGEEVARFDVDLGGRGVAIQAIVWDEINELIWVAAAVSNIFGYNTNGELQTTLSRRSLRVYGLAHWPDAPDNYTLFILFQPNAELSRVYKMNTITGDTAFVKTLEHPDGLTIDNGGIFATNQFDVYSWVFMHLAGAGASDRIDIWQLDARKDWFKLYFGAEEAEIGIINAGTTQDFNLILNSTDLPEETIFDGMLEFYHNAIGLETIIDVRLDVIGDRPPNVFNLLEPANGDTINPYVADSMNFVWEASIDPNIEDEVFYVIWFEVDGDSGSINIPTWQTNYSTDLSVLAEDLDFSLEVDIPLNWWVQAVSGEDTVECTERYYLDILPNSIPSGVNTPVEFGLHSIYPSPFNSMTSIQFGVDIVEPIELAIYDLLGRQVVKLFDSMPMIGYHRVVWNAQDVPSGLYIVKLSAGDRIQNAKVTLIR